MLEDARLRVVEQILALVALAAQRRLRAIIACSGGLAHVARVNIRGLICRRTATLVREGYVCVRLRVQALSVSIDAIDPAGPEGERGRGWSHPAVLTMFHRGSVQKMCSVSTVLSAAACGVRVDAKVSMCSRRNHLPTHSVACSMQACTDLP